MYIMDQERPDRNPEVICTTFWTFVVFIDK